MPRPETDAIFPAQEHRNSVRATTSQPRRFYPSRPEGRERQVRGRRLKVNPKRSDSVLIFCAVTEIGHVSAPPVRRLTYIAMSSGFAGGSIFAAPINAD